VAGAALALFAAADVGMGIAHTGYGATAVAVDNPIPLVPVPVPPVLPAPAPAPAPACTTAHGPFLPTEVSLPGLDEQVPVLPLRRDANNVPGVPPLTSLGKAEMAFDLGSGIRPGGSQGNALLNAHTWPDGSALGNRLLDGLHKGDQIVLQGSSGKLCYKVTDRVEVPATDPGKRYYDTKGDPQIALVVCSGKRLGPGHWTMRTIWYASPSE
jgi:hypothetical protein